ncbi:MAG: MBOAT family protein [Thermostichus sp. DG02_5_bins_236]
MLFSSFTFIFLFLPLCLGVYFWIGRFGSATLSKGWLLLSSLFFYGYWNITFVPLIFISVGINYQLGKCLRKRKLEKRPSKIFLCLGLSFNIGLIAYYKYADFLLSCLPSLSFSTWLSRLLDVDNVVLPLAISFYTFQQIAYLVDVYRGERASYSFLDYSLFVLFFPQLIAGPIIHHQEVIPQFNRLRNLLFSQKNFALGCVAFFIGLSKKVIVSDNISGWVTLPFSHAMDLSFIEAWTAALSYTHQLYFDFSGYCDMALGLGLMLNIKLPINFSSPYKSVSIVEFWRRWHITLSNFLRDYLYIPLGGNRLGETRRVINLMITMLLGGFWHGAGWTYIAWGGFHGVCLSINHISGKLEFRFPKVISWVVTFLAVTIGWVIFRAQSLRDAGHILWVMAGMEGILLPGKYRGSLGPLEKIGVRFSNFPSLDYFPGGLESLVVLTVLTLWVVFLPNTQQLVQRFRPEWWWGLFLSCLSVLSLLSMSRVTEFLYFQF